MAKTVNYRDSPASPALLLHLRPALERDQGQFAALAQQNPELRLERTLDLRPIWDPLF